jgi:RNA polymerase sigma factor (sigma-70 family)
MNDGTKDDSDPMSPERGARILEESYKRLRYHIRRRMGSHLRRRETSSDLLQSVCRVALLGLQRRRFANPKHFCRWLFCLATRKTIERARYHYAARRDLRREAPPPGSTCWLLATDASPVHSCERRETEQELHDAAETLAPDDRKLWRLRQVDRLRLSDIACLLGVADGTVRMRWRRLLVRIGERAGDRRAE